MRKSTRYSPRRNRARDRRVRRLTRAGFTDAAIANKLKVSRSRVGQLVKRLGLPSGLARREAVRLKRQQRVAEVLAQDKSACIQEIARRTGLSPKTAARICEQIGRLAKSEAMALRRQQVVALVGQGLSTVEIAVRLGITREEVAADALAMGVGFRGPRASLSPRRRKVALLAAQGVPVSEIAEQLGMAESVVYKDRLVTGIAATQRAKQTAAQAERMAKVATLTAKGLGADAIAAELGVGRATVTRDRQRLKLQAQKWG